MQFLESQLFLYSLAMDQRLITVTFSQRLINKAEVDLLSRWKESLLSIVGF